MAGEGDEKAQPEAPDEQALREQLEREIRELKVEDLVLQSAVSVLNLAARRIGKEDERDLAQAKVGIDAARALTELVPEQARSQLRQAVSELQLLYAKHAGEGAESEEEPASGSEGPAEEPKKPKGDSGLWTPHGSD